MMRSNVKETILAGLLFVFSSAFTACSRGNDSAQAKSLPPPPASVQVQTLKNATLQDSIESVGTLQAEQTVSISPQTASLIAEVLVKPGDHVRKGQLLFRLTPNQTLPQFASAQFNLNAVIAARDNSERQIKAARATLASAQAQLDLNRVNNQRYQYLVSQGAIDRATADQYAVSEKTQTATVQNAREQLGAAQASLIQANANVRKAKADAQTNKVAFNLNQVTSPIDGLVGNITLKAGDYVTTGQALTTINQNNAFDLQIPIPINYAGQLQRGITVALLDPNSGNQLGSGTIYFISSQTNSTNQTIQTRARFSNPNGRLRDAQYVRARVIWKNQPGILVPTEAVSPIGGQNFVYVATNKTGNNGKTQTIAQQVPVTLGSIQGQSYQVLKGLKPGDKVITTGVSRLRNGAPIAPQETNNNASTQPLALPPS